MFVFARALTYSTLFIGFLLVFIPGRILARTGIVRPAHLGGVEVAALALVVLGGAPAFAGCRAGEGISSSRSSS